MDLIGYCDLGTKGFFNSLDGDTISIGGLAAGETIRVKMKFRETRQGVPIEVIPTINGITASLGVVDTRPTSGTWVLDVNGEDTSALDFDVSADDLKTAIEALASFSSGDVEVVSRDESLIVTFPNDPTTVQTLTIESNRIHPVSHVRVRTYERGGVVEHEIRIMRTPVANTSTYELQNPPIPTVTELRAGGISGDTKFSEIQKLFIPPTFLGTFRLTRNGVRTEPISLTDTADDIKTKLKVLADEGGTWKVENPYESTAYIYFEGDMSGDNQDLLGVEVFDGPGADTVVTLDTKTREMADLMQSVDSTTLILEIRIQIEDPDDPGVYYWHTAFREEIIVSEASDWDELATSAPIDWLRPPTHVSYNPFDPSQVSTGNQHYSTQITDASNLTHVVDHNLDEDRIAVLISENSSPGDSLVEGTDFNWVRSNSNSISITFTSAPASPGVLVTVMSLTETSQFDDHTHLISEVTGLQTVLDQINARLASLELIGGSIRTEENEDDSGETARWNFPSLFEVYPDRKNVSYSGSGLSEDQGLIDLDMTPYGRAGGLLPAIHDATVEDLPVPVPTAGPTYANKVYQNNTGSDVVIPSGRGHRSLTAKDGDYVGCDGRLWYPVSKYGYHADVNFTTEVSSSTSLITFDSSATRNDYLPLGAVVQLETTGTLPAGLSTSTDYIIDTPDFDAGTFTLKDSNGDTVVFSDDGSGTHNVAVIVETSYYPRHYERTLFEFYVNDNQLRAKKTLDCNFSLEAAIRESDIKAYWWLMVEVGEAVEDTTPSTIGPNLDDIQYRGVPLFEQRIVLMPTSTIHRFGAKIKRTIQDAVDTFVAEKRLYGSLSGGCVPPRTANFAIRARLGRFDTEDGESDPRGFVVIKGLKHEQEETVGQGPDDGAAFIS